MRERLPNGWTEVRLGDICLPVEKIQPDNSPNEAFTYFDIGGIDNEINEISDVKVILGKDAPSRARQLLSSGDILFSTVRTYLRKIAQVRQEYFNPVASTGFAVVRPVEGISARFLFFQLLSERFIAPLNSLQSGSSYPAVRAKDVFAQTIVLPPYNEQLRIAEKLDTAFAALKKAEAASLRAQARIAAYSESLLEAAMNGSLLPSSKHIASQTQKVDRDSGELLLARILASRREEWKEFSISAAVTDKKAKSREAFHAYKIPRPPIVSQLPPLPDGWTWASPEQVSAGTKNSLSIGPFGSDLRVSDYRDDGVPLVFVRNIRSGAFFGEDTRYITPRKAEQLSAHQVIGGDILITKMGDPPGEACVYPSDAPPAVITSDCLRLSLTSTLAASNSFFAYAINSPLVKRQILQITKGVAQQKVSLFRFSNIALPLPPLDEQKQIAAELDSRLSAASQLHSRITQQLSRSRLTAQALLRIALEGKLVPQDVMDQPAELLVQRSIRLVAELAHQQSEESSKAEPAKQKRKPKMQSTSNMSSDVLLSLWKENAMPTDARELFNLTGLKAEQVVQFYESLRAAPEILASFMTVVHGKDQDAPQALSASNNEPTKRGRFRLRNLWLEQFKNLADYSVHFEPSQGLDVVLGWNGTGKSNLFESLVIIFRELTDFCEKNKWSDKALPGFRLSYEIDEQMAYVVWDPRSMKRPEISVGEVNESSSSTPVQKTIKRELFPLPRFVFGYYSGPTNRLAEHFLPMKQAHYVRLREAESDDPSTLAKLLEQRRFFCAETHHAKYVLLAFSYKEDSKIKMFLENRLRIVGFESALFIIRKPRWARKGSKAEDYWGARGIMRRVLQRLQKYAVAPMTLKQNVSHGYQSSVEDHYYFFLPDIASLHAFAAEYEDARTFFLALESTDFSELIHDVKIQVRVKAGTDSSVPITFHQLSEGEQQLLMVLGLLRFTKSHQSLVLLDEPDTHLNPHWSVEYLKDLSSVMSDSQNESTEQRSSQILIATHDPLVIASLVRQQIHLLKRDAETLKCFADQPFEDPRGLGFTGILTSDMFGFRSDLDADTMKLLDAQVNLAVKEELSAEEAKRLAIVTEKVESLGFKSASSDPYYRAFLRAIMKRDTVHSLLLKPILNKSDRETLQRETSEILEEIAKEEVKTL